MARPRPSVVLLASVALGVGLGLALRRRPEAVPLRLVQASESDLDAAATALAPAAPVEAEVLRRVPLDEELVRKLMPVEGKGRMFDPYCYFVSLPRTDQERKWPEYPGGAFRSRTNSLGLHQDFEGAAERPDLRVLVAGDSHMTGVCNNADGAPGRLMTLLRERHPGRTIEVWNGSQGAYSFYHYLGVLERALAQDWDIDAFLVVVYGGNDFMGGAFLWHTFHGTKRVRHEREALLRMNRAAEGHTPAMGQVMNQVQYFESGGPDEVALASDMARLTTREMARLCAEHGIAFAVAYLPAPVEVPGAAVRDEVDACLAEMLLPESSLEVSGRLADRLVDDVRALGALALDLRPVFRAAVEAGARDLYWRKDLHLALPGHDLAARAALPWAEEVLAARDAR